MGELRNPKAGKPKLRPLDPKQGPVPVFSQEEVARHGTRESAWIIVDGKVGGQGNEGVRAWVDWLDIEFTTTPHGQRPTNQPPFVFFQTPRQVYDVTEYVDIHPGDDAILNYVGGDSSKGFHGPQHPASVWDVIREFYIGDLAK